MVEKNKIKNKITNKENKEIEKLKNEIKVITVNRDDLSDKCHKLYTQILEQGKTINVLLPLVPTNSLIQIFSEIYNLREETKKLKCDNQYLHSKKGRAFMDRTEEIGFSEAMLELGEYKDT